MKKLKDIFRFIKENRYINKYTITLVIFFIWLLFFDSNSVWNMILTQQEQQEVNQESEIYRKNIEKSKATIDILNSSTEAIEKFAREEYKMKNKNEDIFIIKE